MIRGPREVIRAIIRDIVRVIIMELIRTNGGTNYGITMERVGAY